MTTAGHLENVATMAVAAATVVGLYAFGAGAWSTVGFIFLLNLNYRSKAKA